MSERPREHRACQPGCVGHSSLRTRKTLNTTRLLRAPPTVTTWLNQTVWAAQLSGEPLDGPPSASHAGVVTGLFPIATRSIKGPSTVRTASVSIWAKGGTATTSGQAPTSARGSASHRPPSQLEDPLHPAQPPGRPEGDSSRPLWPWGVGRALHRDGAASPGVPRRGRRGAAEPRLEAPRGPRVCFGFLLSGLAVTAAEEGERPLRRAQKPCLIWAPQGVADI